MKIFTTKIVNLFMYSLLSMFLSQVNIAVAGDTSAYCHNHTCDCNKPMCKTKGFRFGSGKIHHFDLNCKKPYPKRIYSETTYTSTSSLLSCRLYKGSGNYHITAQCDNGSPHHHTLWFKIYCKK